MGIDIGGTGVKAAMVDLASGALATDRLRTLTPRPATPDAVTAVVVDLVRDLGGSGPVGAAFPAVVQRGVARSAANVDPSWIGVDVAATLSAATGVAVVVLNDADAAGLAEMRVGTGRGVPGVVVMVTFGTGIGTGLFVDGTVVPNTELGHLELDGEEAEKRAAYAVREREGLSWSEWARRVERYLRHVEMLLTPDLLIVGGGASKKAEKWLPLVKVATPLRVAGLRNNAGIVGAAFRANEVSNTPR
ncbi:MAG TPA: ROK family protein [Acidimicrobiales bacterium]|nr:ROK family protein [Acidimicrobiales bacterium]